MTYFCAPGERVRKVADKDIVEVELVFNDGRVELVMKNRKDNIKLIPIAFHQDGTGSLIELGCPDGMPCDKKGRITINLD